MSHKMPRDITHIILADEAAKAYKSKEILNNLSAFHMGCVAEDAFLYSLSPQLSTRLHGGLGDDTRAVALEMMDELKKEKNPHKRAIEKAFVCGYLCHMAADCNFHPLIYSISGSQLACNNRSKDDVALSKACHRYAETWLDVYLMRDKHISFKNFRPFRQIVRNMAMRIHLDDFFTDCYQNALKAKKYTWGDNLDLQAQFHNGMTRQFFVDKITQNQTVAGMLRKLDKVFHGRLKLYTSGFYNFSGDIPSRLTAGSFIHPVTGEIVQKSLADLERDTIQYSVQFFRAVDDYIKYGDREAFLKAVPNINGDTGLENSKLVDIRKIITQEDFASMIGERLDTREKVKLMMRENSRRTSDNLSVANRHKKTVHKSTSSKNIYKKQQAKMR